ncbi:MAG: hypothetical protein WBB25_01450 [Sulfitobacter sp.]
MAYSTYHAPAHGGTTFRTIAASIGDGFAAVFSGLGRVIEANSIGHARLARVERLKAGTDAELADLGIKRREIVHHVFRDLYGV